MTHALGDPAHINLGHNELLALIQEQADRFMVTVTLPDTATLGESGHVDDHNLIVAALQAIADAPAGAGPPTVDEGSSTGVTFSTLTDPDGDGKDYRLAVWNGNGTLAVTEEGIVDGLVLSGGGGGATYGGEGGRILVGKFILAAATHTVTVGAAAVAGTDTGVNQLSGYSQLGPVITGRAAVGMNYITGSRGGYPVAGTDYAAGYPSSITGSSVTYGLGAPATPRANKGDGGNAAVAGSAGVVIARWEII